MSQDLCVNQKIQRLSQVTNSHKIWDNLFLLACHRGDLSLSDFQYFFSQYYFYTKNFTKLLAAVLLQCDSDYFRAEISRNLWEESGGIDVDMRHAEIYRVFLTKTLNIDLEHIVFADHTRYFFEEYLRYCIQSTPLECAAILSIATEGIVSKLYAIFKEGLLKSGITEEALEFFNIHIEVDDQHAETLKELLLSYQQEENWFLKAEKAITKALDLRDNFFSAIHADIIFKKTNTLIENIQKKTPLAITQEQCKNLYSHIEINDNLLYKNTDESENIKFSVNRFPFPADVIDPRLVRISVGCTNELHRHAHETVFLILAGTGQIYIDEHCTAVKSGDVVYVPRWRSHQTHNTGNIELIFFAVTDYGLTKQIPENTEEIYRRTTGA